MSSENLVLSNVSESYSSLDFGGVTFENVAESAGIEWDGQENALNIGWVDFNNDNFPDLWIAPHKFMQDYQEILVKLYLNNQDGTFTDIAAQIFNEVPWRDRHGTTWVDFDNDGELDLSVTVGGSGGNSTDPGKSIDENELWVNQDGILSNQAVELGIDFSLARGRSSYWLDYDQDGLLDLIQINVARDDGLAPPTVFRQTENGFENVNETVGFNFAEGEFVLATDLFGDETLDIIGNKYISGLTVYNVTDGVFEDITDQFPDITRVRNAVSGDFDGDLVPDLLFSRDKGYWDSFLLEWESSNMAMAGLNKGQGPGELGFSFQTTDKVSFDFFMPALVISEEGYEPAEDHAIEDPLSILGAVLPLSQIFIGSEGDNPTEYGFSLSVAEVKGIVPESERIPDAVYIGYEPLTETLEVILTQETISPQLDILVQSDAPINNLEAIGFTKPDLAEQLAYSPALLTYDNETGQYVNTTRQAGLNAPIGAQSVIAEDFDNDMDLDIYMTSSYKFSALTSVFYENQGDGTFIEVVDAAGALIVPTGPGITFANHGMSAAAADYNRDGFLDLAIGNSALPANSKTYLGTPHYLFENQGNDNNWLQIDLEGVVSNRDAIGAKVFVTAGDKTQLREQFLGQHFYGQNQDLLHFGLADYEIADVIRIKWPSGAIQEFENIAANQIFKVVENQGTEGSDLLIGTASDDIIKAGKNADELYGENKNDQLLGQGGPDKIYGGRGRDILRGGNGNDQLLGQGGLDKIYGGRGRDILNGGNGNDILEGGRSRDVLIGGKGFDDFVFQSLSEKVDQIKDFVSGVDEIKINKTGFSDLLEVGVLPDEQFVIGTAPLDENDYLIYNQTKGVLFFDSDGLGDQAKIRLAVLKGAPILEASDIFIFE